MFDLRSDTVTRPGDAMRAAMAAAEVGDDVLEEDPTVQELEAEAARLLGHEAALFVPSGTMGNQLCLGLLTRPGDEVIAEAESHILYNEVGSASRLWGLQVRSVCGRRGVMSPDDVAAQVRHDDIHYPRTSLLSIENTHNYSGGCVVPPDAFDALVETARAHELAVHMDGARLFNAAVALDLPASRWASRVDMVSVCLSKGLGAPVGSVVAASAARIAAARKLRKALGGGMRQVGILAAAGLLALREGPALLAHDHRRARALAERVAALPGAEVDLDAVQTNLLFVRTTDAEAVEAALRERGVLALAVDDVRVRFVFHRDVGDDAVDAAAEACAAVLG